MGPNVNTFEAVSIRPNTIEYVLILARREHGSHVGRGFGHGLNGPETSIGRDELAPGLEVGPGFGFVSRLRPQDVAADLRSKTVFLCSHGSSLEHEASHC